MAWSQVGATPGSAITVYVNDDLPVYGATVYCLPIDGITIEQMENGIYKIPLVSNPSGELEYTGGGGSARPGSGFLYPRG